MKEDKFSVGLSILLTSFLYAFFIWANGNFSSIGMFWINNVALGFMILLMYLVFRLTKMNIYLKLFLSGFLAPILNNIIYIIRTGIPFTSLFPVSLLDSAIIGLMFVGIYQLTLLSKKMVGR